LNQNRYHSVRTRFFISWNPEICILGIFGFRLRLCLRTGSHLAANLIIISGVTCGLGLRLISAWIHDSILCNNNCLTYEVWDFVLCIYAENSNYKQIMHTGQIRQQFQYQAHCWTSPTVLLAVTRLMVYRACEIIYEFRIFCFKAKH